MKADRLGLLSAMLASVCCLGPVLLVLVGLGSLGVGAFLGRYHWWFIAAAIYLLSVAWRSYLTEAARCRAASCHMVRGKTTRTILVLVSGIVAIFAGLNAWSTVAQSDTPTSTVSAPDGKTVAIPTKGMTCAMCEVTIEQSLAKHPGVLRVDAQVATEQVLVTYDAKRIGLGELMEAINKAGYQTQAPAEGEQP